MAQSKPMGISKKEFENHQSEKADDDFKYQTNQKIQEIQLSIDELSLFISKTCELQKHNKVDCDIQHGQLTTMVMDKLKGFNSTLDNFDKVVKELVSTTTKSLERLDDFVLKTQFSQDLDHINKVIHALDRIVDNLRNEVTAALRIKTCDFDAKLKALKEEILSRPTGIPELRKELDDKIELATLNGTNSVLRTTNNERQLLLIDKKIENIYQLIKQIELR